MVLKIFRDEIWDEIEVKSFRDLYNYQNIQEANESFRNSPIHIVQTHEFSLYCNQQEFGIDLPESEYEIIGSDDATTCHIILASYSAENDSEFLPQQRRWVISHLASVAGVQEFGNYFHQIALEIGQVSHTFEIYLMGGFGDGGDQLSEKLSQEFINFFHSSPHIFQIRLFFTCEVNTISQQRSRDLSPRFYGCGYRKATNSVVPMTFPIAARGPEYFTRSIALWLQPSASQQNHSTLLLLCRTTTLRIDFSFLTHDISPDYYIFFRSLSLLPRTPATDQLILRQTSTSPSCEPYHFVSSVREIATYIAQHFSPNGKSQYQGPLLAIYQRQQQVSGPGSGDNETQIVEWVLVS
jgi:hypothetical protein